MSRFLLLLVWMFLVFLAARLIPNWQLRPSYADLLPTSAQQVLAQQPPLSVDVFALPDSPAANLVDNFLEPLISGLSEVEVNYLDVSNNLELVKQHQINKQGEMLISSKQAHFKLSTLSYEAFFNGLKKMSQPRDQWVVFLENIEGKPFSSGQVGSLSDWLAALKSANYSSMVLSWHEQLALPQQAKLLILASPSAPFDQAKMTWLEDQIKAGKSVLWLTDPQTVIVQPELSLLFDVMRTDSFHAGHLVVKDYPEHGINQFFDRPIDLVDVVPFETANESLWVNEQKQTLAATNELGNSRLMVIGDSDFLSNEFLSSGGNLEMSFRLVDWLLKHDNRIDLPSIGLGQTQLFFSQSEVLSFAGIMLVLIPLLFLILGVYHWRKNK